MSKEHNSVFIGILITLVYAFTMWIEKGVFLYPFPLNEFIFLFVSAQIIRLNFLKHPSIALISGITALFYLVSSPFFWGFFLDEIYLNIFIEDGLFDLIKFLYFLSTFFWMIFTLQNICGRKKYIFYSVLIPIFIISIFILQQELSVLSILLVSIISLIYNLKVPFNLLWVLLAYLSTMKFLVFFFN